ncbi:hypothetical protein P879_00641 [Paragonimus westermani]|uniref:FERM domain-containing protein n=1 Tax=Paragonimus westermani TaxID=34504 RepID=A0A8T0DWE3_9TREM|nr:hypothetical protein P879_00641 [Paragonimus westermani]
MKLMKRPAAEGGKGNKSTSNNVAAADKKNQTAKKSDDKRISCKIRLLDDAQPPLEFEISKKDLGRQLFSRVCNGIGNLAECDYFGLRYTDKHSQRQWIDLDRSVYKQLKGNCFLYCKQLFYLKACHSFNMSFRLKHYPSDPVKDLKQELTRYLVYLQVRRDLTQGRLLCPPPMMATIGALVAQAELGDAPPGEELELSSVHENPDISVNIPENPHTPSFTETRIRQPNSSPERPGSIKKDTNYLAGFRIFLSQTPKLEAEIMKRHQQLRGLTSQEAETEFLNRTSQFPTFGIDRFPVIPHQTVSLTHGTGDEGKSKSPGNSHSPIMSKSAQTPKGVAYYMGITGTGLVLFVGLQRSQEYHWDEINRLACDGKLFLVYLKKDEPGPGKRLFWVYKKKTGPLTFECESKAAALALWHWTVDRKCFFTLQRASEAKRLRPSSSIFQRNKTYRFSGRSHQELNSIQITDTKNDFIRVSSLRHATGSASVGHTTFPSRIRPPLNLKEIYAPKETVNDHILPTASTEAVKAVLVPDTVIEQPVEDDPVTLTIPELEDQVKSEPEAEAATEHVPEPPVEAKQIPQQLASTGDFASESNSIHRETSEAMEIRKRLDPSAIHAVVCEQVVSALDRTIDTLEVGLGNADANKRSTAVNDEALKTKQRNGPYCSQSTTIQPASEEGDRRIASPELIKTSAISGATTATVTAVVVMLVVGLIVIMETNPTTNSTVLRFMRSNAIISGFDSFIYNPLRNAITTGLSIFWSTN